jgi:hypothetical protein
MNLISSEERIDLLKNLLADPNDWISAEILRLADMEADVDICSISGAAKPDFAKQ